ncbi:hypothetical protein HanRHA438_Chr07g0299371 [Helianthus annuus]|uniref:Uncharacterized protein n=1 Tax=Helianthus annuus TaxID=4232 RepID=A0A9K3NF20_HELAN|nr:hypothetical protein HanXRQr2_Chr07g0288781 [Helianthus annuus]KAJ0556247.1 hypothetical protein HanIR_Chr07g0311601 [Helianthus annuus]KAJ0562695.1 hypothetical protein HanHA89_Chr07g0254581 [Helianthus annuus]KAJ0728072.1 hypothetical protein HanLR1_Chr07g0237361 [Helianthus annuus]KAJ0730847.1 hypothetical protein HanOQP8_Chr07g0245081 [Helianthus annuus]
MVPGGGGVFLHFQSFCAGGPGGAGGLCFIPGGAGGGESDFSPMFGDLRIWGFSVELELEWGV